jgi:hypothetical protein
MQKSLSFETLRPVFSFRTIATSMVIASCVLPLAAACGPSVTDDELGADLQADTLTEGLGAARCVGHRSCADGYGNRDLCLRMTGCTVAEFGSTPAVCGPEPLSPSPLCDGKTSDLCREAWPCESFGTKSSCEHQYNCSWSECGSNDDCSGSNVCSNRKCVPALETSKPCSRSDQCKTGNCSAKQCVPAPGTGLDGEFCNHDTQCRNICFESECQPKHDLRGRCAEDSDCLERCDEAAEVCIAHYLSAPDGTFCTRDGQCINACISGRCAPRRDYGGYCDSNADCLERRCDRGLFTTNTGKCIPNDGTGKSSDYCTHNNHCDGSRGLVCRLVSGRNYGYCR